jgi:hypothetical protein
MGRLVRGDGLSVLSLGGGGEEREEWTSDDGRSMPRPTTVSRPGFRQPAVGISRAHQHVVGLARFVILLFALVGDEVLVGA